MKANDLNREQGKYQKKPVKIAELIRTCKNQDDEDSKYVGILCQDTRSVHRHVLSAEILDVFSN